MRRRSRPWAAFLLAKSARLLPSIIQPALTTHSQSRKLRSKIPRFSGGFMRTLRCLICLAAVGAVISLSFARPVADTFRPVVRGKRGAVAAGHPLSAEAGLRLLRQGGNATDAGCAAILAASVMEFSHF